MAETNRSMFLKTWQEGHNERKMKTEKADRETSVHHSFVRGKEKLNNIRICQINEAHLLGSFNLQNFVFFCARHREEFPLISCDFPFAYLRSSLIGKTVNLLQLYLQPFLQGYPAFKDLPALYKGVSDLNGLLVDDLRPLGDIKDFMDIFSAIEKIAANIERRLMHYATAVGTIVEEFGNIEPGDSEVLKEVKEITGKLLFFFLLFFLFFFFCLLYCHCCDFGGSKKAQTYLSSRRKKQAVTLK